MPGETEAISLPKEPAELFKKISDKVGKFGGCWDIFAWKDGGYIFVELKRKSKDKIQESQEKWLDESLKLGISKSSFTIVEWNI
jgi:hypothetical protein